MKGSELKKEISSLTPEEKAELERMTAIAKIRKQKNITQDQLAKKRMSHKLRSLVLRI